MMHILQFSNQLLEEGLACSSQDTGETNLLHNLII
jgi:hypothetical protein